MSDRDRDRERVYSPFWAGCGVRSAQRSRGLDLPSSSELEAYSNLPLSARQAQELRHYGRIISQPDAMDRRLELGRQAYERRQAAKKKRGE